MSSVLTKGKKKRADEAALAGRLDEACTLYKSVCKIDRADVEAWVKLGEASRRLGDYAQAESANRRALSLQPRLGYAHYGLGAALHCQGKRDEAVLCYRSAIQFQPELPDAHYFLGSALLESGDVAGAVGSLHRALALRPNYFAALSDLGAALVAMGNYDEAEPILRRARAIEPNSAEVLGNLGSIHERRGLMEDALQLYRQGLASNPASVGVQAKLGELLERLNRLDEAERVVSSALIQVPDHPALGLIAARLDRRAGRLEAAIDRLERLLPAVDAAETAAEIHLLLGQLHDAANHADKVFPHLNEGKRLIAAATDPLGTARERFLQRVDRALLGVEGIARQASAAICRNAEDSPIFVVGFPRSGTTLLEQVLDSHPSLQALDERPIIAALENKVVEWNATSPDAIARLTDEQLKKLRDVYFSEAARYLERREGSRLVDKLPLNIVSIPLIWRVFPDAPIVLALRHPYDVCLSCFMQSFGQNDAMAGFVSLASIAEIYARVMGAWVHYVDVLPLKWRALRYEDLISNFDPECRALIEFLGLDWSDAILEHTSHARSRIIKTPSYHQVTQPIYQHAKYRWRRYESEFAGVKATLEPFVDRFGYL